MSRRPFLLTLAALAGLALAPANARRVFLRAPYAFRVATFDAIVVGTVTQVAEKVEKAGLYKGDDRRMKGATVRVASALLGRPGPAVSVGYIIAPPARAPGRPAVRQAASASLSRGQEVCLFLTQHPSREGTYFLASAFDVLFKSDHDDWNSAMLDEVRKYAGLLARPVAGLTAKDAGGRILTAALLIERYKTPTDSRRTEPVPARESKALLTALAEADWDKVPRSNYKLNPRALFFQLGATEKDGWRQPREYAAIAPAAKRWLKDNAGKFKMTRFVRPKVSTELSEEPGK